MPGLALGLLLAHPDLKHLIGRYLIPAPDILIEEAVVLEVEAWVRPARVEAT